MGMQDEADEADDVGVAVHLQPCSPTTTLDEKRGHEDWQSTRDALSQTLFGRREKEEEKRFLRAWAEVIGERGLRGTQTPLKLLHRGRVRRTGLHCGRVCWSMAYHPVPTKTVVPLVQDLLKKVQLA